MDAGFATFIPFIALAVIAGLATFAIKRVKKQLAERVRTLQEFGFFACKPVDATVVGKVAAVASLGKSKASISQLYQRHQGSFDLYLADINRTGDSDSSNPTSIVMIIPHASIPQFTVTPRIPGQGRLSALANSLLAQIARRPGFKDVTIGAGSEFDRRYGLSAPEGDAILAGIPADVWNRLAALPQLLSIDAGGDTIVFSVVVTSVKSARYNFENFRDFIRTHIELAERINELFAHIRAGRPTFMH
jgi:hypothetical protein